MTSVPVLLLSLVPVAAAASAAPGDGVSALYARLDDAGGVVPAGLLGAELDAALRAWQAYEGACAALARPGDKPHMLDQSPWLSAPDRPDTINVEPVRAAGPAAWVPVHMTAGGMAWTDRVLLRQQAGRWEIVDIRWGDGGSLVGRLKAFSAYRCTP